MSKILVKLDESGKCISTKDYIDEDNIPEGFKGVIGEDHNCGLCHEEPFLEELLLELPKFSLIDV